jgi:hypothetical protein
MDFHDPCDKDRLTGCKESWLFAWVQKVCRVVPGGAFTAARQPCDFANFRYRCPGKTLRPLREIIDFPPFVTPGFSRRA